MRPVTKPAPATLPPAMGDAETPAQRLMTALLDTVGDYCALCEMSIESGGYVQSKRTGVPQKTPRLDAWTDLLPVCTNCAMQRAGDAPVTPDGYLWPDVDATFTLTSTSPFVYALTEVTVVQEGSADASGTQQVVLVKANPSSKAFTRAQATLDLYQLNTRWYDANTNTLTVPKETPEFVDRRLALRTFAWRRARAYIEVLRQGEKEPSFLEGMWLQAASGAQTAGFWSVWMTTFWAEYQDPKLLDRLFVQTTTKRGYIISGYQSVEKKEEDEAPLSLPGRPQPPPPGGPWTIFTGTAVSRLAYPTL